MKKPHGIHVHDGPGFKSQNINKEKRLIFPSTFQVFIILYSEAFHYDNNIIRYYPRPIEIISISISSSEILDIPPCKPQLNFKTRYAQVYDDIITHTGNKHCVYNITADAGYVNLSVKSMSYRGPQFSGNLRYLPVVHCLQGGLAYETAGDRWNLKEKQFHHLCNTYTSKDPRNNTFNSTSYHKSVMDIISAAPTMILVIYSYEHYSEVTVSATVTTARCRGAPYYGGL